MNQIEMFKRPMITLYTRNGCHLCEQAKDVIRHLQTEYEFDYDECDISQRDEWTEKYGLIIPVIVIDGKEVQYGRIDAAVIINKLLK